MNDDIPITKPVLIEALAATEKRLIEYIDERTRDMQTELLRGFRSYQDSISIRLAKLTADTGNIDTATDKRMTNIEERLAEIEQRLPPPPHRH